MRLRARLLAPGMTLVKQLISRMDNYRRLQAPPAQKRFSVSGSPDNAKKVHKDAYGCINPEPKLLAGETKQLQKQKQEELIQFFKNKDKDAENIETNDGDVSFSEERHIIRTEGDRRDPTREAFPL